MIKKEVPYDLIKSNFEHMKKEDWERMTNSDNKK